MFRLPIVKFFSRILNRATITIVLVALQVLWLLWAFWVFTTGRVWLNGLLKALSIVIVLYLVRKDENSAYKIGWIVLIGLLPLLGGALYLAFGNKAPAKGLRTRMRKVEQAHTADLAPRPDQTDTLDRVEKNLSHYVERPTAPTRRGSTPPLTISPAARPCTPGFWKTWNGQKNLSFLNSSL